MHFVPGEPSFSPRPGNEPLSQPNLATNKKVALVDFIKSTSGYTLVRTFGQSDGKQRSQVFETLRADISAVQSELMQVELSGTVSKVNLVRDRILERSISDGKFCWTELPPEPAAPSCRIFDLEKRGEGRVAKLSLDTEANQGCLERKNLPTLSLRGLSEDRLSSFLTAFVSSGAIENLDCFASTTESSDLAASPRKGRVDSNVKNEKLRFDDTYRESFVVGEVCNPRTQSLVYLLREGTSSRKTSEAVRLTVVFSHNESNAADRCGLSRVCSVEKAAELEQEFFRQSGNLRSLNPSQQSHGIQMLFASWGAECFYIHPPQEILHPVGQVFSEIVKTLDCGRSLKIIGQSSCEPYYRTPCVRDTLNGIVSFGVEVEAKSSDKVSVAVALLRYDPVDEALTVRLVPNLEQKLDLFVKNSYVDIIVASNFDPFDAAGKDVLKGVRDLFTELVKNATFPANPQLFVQSIFNTIAAKVLPSPLQSFTPESLLAYRNIRSAYHLLKEGSLGGVKVPADFVPENVQQWSNLDKSGFCFDFSVFVGDRPYLFEIRSDDSNIRIYAKSVRRDFTEPEFFRLIQCSDVNLFRQELSDFLSGVGRG